MSRILQLKSVNNSELLFLRMSNQNLLNQNSVKSKLVHFTSHYLNFESTNRFLLLCDGMLLGCLQSYPIPKTGHVLSKHAMPFGITQGVDLVIDKPQFTSKEFLFTILKKFISQLAINNSSPLSLITVVDINQYRITQIYEKLGFVKISKTTIGDKNYWVMRSASQWATINEVHFVPLYRDIIPKIAKWYNQQWGYMDPKETVEFCMHELQSRLDNININVVYVAQLPNEEVIGTISLLASDMDNKPELLPWLTSLYVAKSYRRFGLGAWLIDNLIAATQNNVHKKLFLFTPNKSNWYKKLGWKFVEHTFYRVEEVDILQKNIET